MFASGSPKAAATSGGSWVIRIRRATVRDVPEILGCLAAAFAPFRRQYTEVAYAATVLDERRLSRRMSRMTVLVAAGPGGRVLGTISVKSVSPPHAHLRGMAVLPEAQGQGVGSRLLRRAVAWARAEGHGVVTLETTEVLREAGRFYRSRGFRETGRTRRWGGMRLLAFERPLTRDRPALRGRRIRGARGVPRGPS